MVRMTLVTNDVRYISYTPGLYVFYCLIEWPAQGAFLPSW